MRCSCAYCRWTGKLEERSGEGWDIIRYIAPPPVTFGKGLKELPKKEELDKWDVRDLQVAIGNCLLEQDVERAKEFARHALALYERNEELFNKFGGRKVYEAVIDRGEEYSRLFKKVKEELGL